MKCIIFEKDGKRYFEGDAPFLVIISEKGAKIIPERVMIWSEESIKQMEYWLDSLHKRNSSIEIVENTNGMETVDTRTAKVVDVKDIPFLRDYCIKKYQKELNKCQEFLNSLV